MKARWTSTILATSSLSVVLFVAFADVDRTSPGPLSPTHLQVEELSGEKGCVLCHGGLFTSMADGCGDCHEGVERDVAEGRGLHGSLIETEDVQVQRCSDCHLEHTGDRVALTTDTSFHRASIPDPSTYDHAALNFRLGGRHLELGCVECHENAEADALPIDSQRFRGLEQACDACHDDVHEGAMARTCADCHGQEHPFSEVVAFEHTQGFREEGAHALESCAKCHDADGAHAVEIMAGAGPFPRDRACADCHDSPHDLGFLRESAVLAKLIQGTECADCHDAAHESFTPPAKPSEAPMTGAQHAATGFPLSAPHAELECAACHDPGDSFTERYPGRTNERCEACHDDPHQDQFEDLAFASTGCLACHKQEAFSPFAFDIESHTETAFALEGAHTAVACFTCHSRSAASTTRVFADAETECASCHEDAHRGLLNDAPIAASDCASCHDSALFANVDRETFDHNQQTSFLLTGAHGELDCESCHTRTRALDETGRTFGFAHAVFGQEAGDCATCHQDPHGGTFEELGRPASITGRTGCARCHVTESFTALAADSFDHELWTGYPLAAEHASVSCEQCHPATLELSSQRLGPAQGRACSDCHTDVHVGQFVEKGRSDCAECHQDDLSLTFDHQTQGRFALDETHTNLDCAACHLPWPLEGGGEAVRYKPLGLTCTACHGPGGGR